jgi:hypothetical protein
MVSNFESVWFPTVNMKGELLVTKFKFKWVNLYRYYASVSEVGLCTLIQVDP